ncbi:MAG: radical SAM protein [Deltaproteobacteria bacterium]|nr:MAG: radical SAM protein [Deltaproteobacteria bacterium]
MEIMHQIKDYATQQIVKKIISLLGKASDSRLIQMTYLGEKLTSDPEVRRAIQKIRYFLQNGHPAKEIFYRVLNYLRYENQVKLFYTLFNNAWFFGGKKRDAFEREHGYRPPFIMILSPTMRCNLRCKGCYTLGYGLKPELEYELVDRILYECEELGIYFVTILGGEPLLYPNLFEIIEGHPDIFFQIYTNGTLMTKEKAKRFADMGNVAVVVSIEGDEQETDSWRGKGVYKKIMEAFEHLNEARVLMGTSATVTRENVEVVSSFEFIDKMIEYGSIAQMYFLYIPVNGQADFSLMVTPEQRDLLRRQVIAIRNTKPIFVLDFWNDGPYVQGCIAGGRRYFHINAKGDVEPCVYTHIAVDNIRHTTLAEALNSKLFRAVRARQPHNENHLRPCMIIDNPHVMRELIAEVKPNFTHPGAEEIYTEKREMMDQYANRWAQLADKIWEEEYVDKRPVN